MLSGFNDIHPVNFVYQHDQDLVINQNTFETQQGLSLNLVNALSTCVDETMLNYSNIFLTSKLPVNDVISLPPKQTTNLSFPTYLGLSAFPSTLNFTKYIQLSTNPGIVSPITLTSSLSNEAQTYFVFTDIDGLRCRISTFDQNRTKNLTVAFSTIGTVGAFQCYFSQQTPSIVAAQSDVFEYSLDVNGYLKLFHRTPTNFYIIRNVGTALSAVNASTTTSLSTDIIGTFYSKQQDIDFKNNFIYYDKPFVKDFIVKEDRSVLNIPQNFVLYYNYQSKFNFLTGSTAAIDLFKTKNVLSNDYYVNDKLPFNKDVTVQRDYTTILSKFNGELYSGEFQLNYNYYTKEYELLPDVVTKFTLPETLYPYSVLNIDNSNLVNAGSYGGLSPVFSDKVIKNLNLNENTVNYNEANGTYLYTWLYTDSNQLTSYWVDRYYFPRRTTLQNAYSGANYQIFNYTSALSTYLNTNYPAANFLYYDIRSSLTFEPSATYFYSRIGNNYITKVVDTFATAVSSVLLVNGDNVPQTETNDLVFDGNTYGAFKLTSDTNNSFTISFDINSSKLDNINSNLIVGNNFDEGISLYKGGKKNIFTPGYFINSLSGINFFDINNSFTFSLNISSFIGEPIRVLDIINTGFDHLIKVLYVNTNTNVPGFLDFSIYNKIFNKYEFTSLTGIFNSGQRSNLFDKTYVGSSEIWYLVKPNPTTGVIYKFDYINNLYLGSINTPTGNKSSYNSFVTFNGSVSTLSGYRGNILDGDLGISKIGNTVYYKDLSAGSEYPVLSASGGIFDLAVLDNKYYIQTTNTVQSYDKYKTLQNTYTNNNSAVSGLKIDFINDNYQTKLLSYVVNKDGVILIDKFDLDTTVYEGTFNTGLFVEPIFFNEFYTAKKASYTDLIGIGILNNAFISGGVENDYTYNTPIISTLTAFNINAIIGAQSFDCTYLSSLTGKVKLSNGLEIPDDVRLFLFQGSTLVSTSTASGDKKELYVDFNGLNSSFAYSLVCDRTTETPDTLVIEMQLGISNGTFYNGSFRNVVVGPTLISPTNTDGFANAFFAFNNASLTEELGFVRVIDAQTLRSNYTPYPSVRYSDNYNFNGKTASNPLFNSYNSPSGPLLQLTVNPDLTAFKPTLTNFVADTNPPITPLSGTSFQVPVNFEIINEVNKFSEGDMVVRSDLFSGNNYLNKQTTITPFNVENNSQITIVFDVNNGFIDIYNNAELIKSTTLSADTFFSSYFLNNNFGVGMPFIDNNAASTIGLAYNDYANYYTLNNFVVYNRPLNQDEVKFNFLKNRKIDAINFDITSGTRNNTDTFASTNRLSIPGRKNNNVKLYIKNANLTAPAQELLSAELLGKLKNILPLNTSEIKIEYINYE